jgi:hypothetical protein
MKTLQFRVSGIPVRVEPIFIGVMALLGWANDHTGFEILVFMAVGGGSILLHELGHATAHKSFGAHPSITLTGFGGYTQGPPQPRGRSPARGPASWPRSSAWPSRRWSPPTPAWSRSPSTT